MSCPLESSLYIIYKELPGEQLLGEGEGQLIAIPKELPINSRYDSKYNFSAIPSLILSSMRFVALNFIVLVSWCSSARVLECFDPSPPKILPYTRADLPWWLCESALQICLHMA
jgi:hypothetical protein